MAFLFIFVAPNTPSSTPRNLDNSKTVTSPTTPTATRRQGPAVPAKPKMRYNNSHTNEPNNNVYPLPGTITSPGARRRFAAESTSSYDAVESPLNRRRLPSNTAQPTLTNGYLKNAPRYGGVGPIGQSSPAPGYRGFGPPLPGVHPLKAASGMQQHQRQHSGY